MGVGEETSTLCIWARHVIYMNKRDCGYEHCVDATHCVWERDIMYMGTANYVYE